MPSRIALRGEGWEAEGFENVFLCLCAPSNLRPDYAVGVGEVDPLDEPRQDVAILGAALENEGARKHPVLEIAFPTRGLGPLRAANHKGQGGQDRYVLFSGIQ